MSDKDNGGFAFPVPNSANMNDQEGMTLRDYFAAKAMQTLLAAHTADSIIEGLAARNICDSAYFIADAMIAERAK